MRELKVSIRKPHYRSDIIENSNLLELYLDTVSAYRFVSILAMSNKEESTVSYFLWLFIQVIDKVQEETTKNRAGCVSFLLLFFNGFGWH